METNDAKRKEDVAKLAELMKDVRIAMLTTVEPSGELRSRPMGVQQVEFDGDLWFFTKEHSAKVEDVQRDQQVNVSFSNPDKQRYVTITGVANLVRDHAKMAELWSPLYKAWFPDGLEDPELALLKVTVNEAEYWDAPPSAVVRVFGYAKAVISGKEYDAGDHGKVDLQKGYVG